MPEQPSSDLWSTVRTPADLGAFLAEVRVRAGWTQDEVAEQLGISRRYLYEIESGRPSLYTDRLFGLLRLLDATLTVSAPDRGEERPVAEPASGSEAEEEDEAEDDHDDHDDDHDDETADDHRDDHRDEPVSAARRPGPALQRRLRQAGLPGAGSSS